VLLYQLMFPLPVFTVSKPITLIKDFLCGLCEKFLCSIRQFNISQRPNDAVCRFAESDPGKCLLIINNRCNFGCLFLLAPGFGISSPIKFYNTDIIPHHALKIKGDFT